MDIDNTVGGVAIESTQLLAEAISILMECEVTWGCECPYCDRDFGKEWDSHADDCRLKKFLDAANTSLSGSSAPRGVGKEGKDESNAG
jgi:hypothetical protein